MNVELHGLRCAGCVRPTFAAGRPNATPGRCPGGGLHPPDRRFTAKSSKGVTA